MLSFECIKNEKSVYFLLTSAAGSQILEKLGSKHGKEVPAAQKQARGKPNTRGVGQQARRRGAGCPKASPREANTSPQKAN